jgi:hypothetical protein
MSINIDNTGANNVTLTNNGTTLLVNAIQLALGSITIEVVASLPGSPDASTLYIVTG